jgi:serine/threonine protein phosphatase 1
MRVRAPFTETVMLMGNHEAMLLDFLEDASKGPLWLANGGAATVQAFGVDPFETGATGDAWLETLRRRMRAALGTARLSFLRGLALSHAEGDYLFVHAGVDPRRPLDRQDPHAMMWIRDVFLSSSADLGKVVVHGHTIEEVPVVRSNRIGIDTGAVLPGGQLTALVLSGRERRFVAVAGEA